MFGTQVPSLTAVPPPPPPRHHHHHSLRPSASRLSAAVEVRSTLTINMNTHAPSVTSKGTTTATDCDSNKQKAQKITKKSPHTMQEQEGDSMHEGDGGGDGGLNISDVLYLTDVDSEALCLHPLYQQ